MAILELAPAFKAVYTSLGISIPRRTPFGETPLVERADIPARS